MKKILLFLSMITMLHFSNAQNVGIGTVAPHASAILEINSPNKGLLLPRLADTSSINNPAKGLVIYSNSNNKVWYYDGTRWQQSITGTISTDGIWNVVRDSIVHTEKEYVSINTDEALIAPKANLQLGGNFLVQGKLQYTKTAPAPAQTYTMNNTAGAQYISNADSVFKILDPGGTGNYNNNMQGNVIIAGSESGVKLSSSATDFGFAAGDTLWISATSFPGCRTNYSYRFTNTSVSPDDMILNSSASFFIFRSNADGANGRGFNFTLTRLYNAQPVEPIQNIGASMSFNGGNGAFSAGLDANNFSSAGYAAIAMGNSVNATGMNAVVIGNSSRATNQYAVAMGYANNALGYAAFALGSNNGAYGASSATLGNGNAAGGAVSLATGGATNADGDYSTSMGNSTRAGGDYSLATGSNTSASGSASTAMGRSTISRGYAGTVVGMYNHPIIGTVQTSAVPTTPLFIVGNGDNSSTLSNALTVLKNGRVGIGTQLPAVTQLQLVGGNDADLTANSGYFVIGDVNSANMVMDNNEIMARNDGASTTLYLQNDGGALVAGGSASKPGGGSWSATSDARLKQHVQPYTDGLQQLQQINPVYFNYNQQSGYDTSKQFIGVVAQELQKVVPYMVGSFKKDGTDYLNVDNTAMTYMLINAVKEQQQQIIYLQKENERIILLVTKMAALEKLLMSKPGK